MKEQRQRTMDFWPQSCYGRRLGGRACVFRAVVGGRAIPEHQQL
jgi:hypothetical protein